MGQLRQEWRLWSDACVSSISPGQHHHSKISAARFPKKYFLASWSLFKGMNLQERALALLKVAEGLINMAIRPVTQFLSGMEAQGYHLKRLSKTPYAGQKQSYSGELRWPCFPSPDTCKMLKAEHTIPLSHALMQKYTAPCDFQGNQQDSVLPLHHGSRLCDGCTSADCRINSATGLWPQ